MKTRVGRPPRPPLELPRPPSGRGGKPRGIFDVRTFFCKDDIFCLQISSYSVILENVETTLRVTIVKNFEMCLKKRLISI